MFSFMIDMRSLGMLCIEKQEWIEVDADTIVNSRNSAGKIQWITNNLIIQYYDE